MRCVLPENQPAVPLIGIFERFAGDAVDDSGAVVAKQLERFRRIGIDDDGFGIEVIELCIAEFAWLSDRSGECGSPLKEINGV